MAMAFASIGLRVSILGLALSVLGCGTSSVPSAPVKPVTSVITKTPPPAISAKKLVGRWTPSASLNPRLSNKQKADILGRVAFMKLRLGDDGTFTMTDKTSNFSGSWKVEGQSVTLTMLRRNGETQDEVIKKAKAAGKKPDLDGFDRPGRFQITEDASALFSSSPAGMITFRKV